MRLALRQRFDFGDEVAREDLSDSGSWDSLRLSGPEAFRLASTRVELDRRASTDPHLRERAGELALIARSLGGPRLASYGVGVGALEALLEGEGLAVTLTEYAPLTVDRLRLLFPKARVVVHDLLVDGPLEDVDVHLFHRIDTELDDEQWRLVLRRFAGVPVIVVAAGIATPRALAREALLRIRRRGTAAGWMRTRDSLRALWAEAHRTQAVMFADLPGWVLRP